MFKKSVTCLFILLIVKIESIILILKFLLGYDVEFSPKPIKISTQGKEVTFSFNSALVGNTIQIVISEEVNAAIFPADFYPELKSFYQNVINKQNEKIILSKI